MLDKEQSGNRILWLFKIFDLLLGIYLKANVDGLFRSRESLKTLGVKVSVSIEKPNLHQNPLNNNLT